MAELESVMAKQFAQSTTTSSAAVGGVKAAANIMGKTKLDIETTVMSDISGEDEELAMRIADNMFDFDNLVDLDNRSIQGADAHAGTRTNGVRIESRSGPGGGEIPVEYVPASGRYVYGRNGNDGHGSSNRCGRRPTQYHSSGAQTAGCRRNYSRLCGWWWFCLASFSARSLLPIPR